MGLSRAHHSSFAVASPDLAGDCGVWNGSELIAEASQYVYLFRFGYFDAYIWSGRALTLLRKIGVVRKINNKSNRECYWFSAVDHF